MDQDAVRALNTLQTNASFLEQVKRERGQPQMQLEAMKAFLERTGLMVEDLDQLNIIHVTGTKGKGSTCAFAERILRNYGLKTGFYSSPHLVQVRERIRINGQSLSKELFTKYFWQVYNRLEETKHNQHGGGMPAYFRFLTILAFHVFLQEKVDLAVIEVGIGGAYDCTNIIRKPVVCGISSLGIDHTSILGDTIEKIAWQKGGIFKPGVPAFTVQQPASPLAVLMDRAREIGCSLHLCPDLDDFELEGVKFELGPEGDHQRLNAALALQLCRTWLQQRQYQDFFVAQDAVHVPELSTSGRPPLTSTFRPSLAMLEGLRNTEWPGRTHVLSHGPLTYYIDGAHTKSSMQACIKWFRERALKEEKTVDGPVARVLLFNTTGERDSAALLKLLQPCQFDCAVFCPNLVEISPSDNADQQNYNVTLENILTRCIENQKIWNKLMDERPGHDVWTSSSLNFEETDSLGNKLLLMPGAERKIDSSSLVFPCISSALQWITQGRDPGLLESRGKILQLQTVGSNHAIFLQEAVTIQVLVTGSLHLVGGVLKLVDQSLSL
ncbi:folylpolyglutamate synthase, mitochondrial isoform X2 [Protopterus annectens]|uniref:folylpolyglutamate synthase, mitochondrial isoform X2 n=1 Tax=Protopterus annectens TaxID=7888 RepID=UPI001CFB0E5A|nr:folylpolyglutamate synthase, mitochondrial isoform X2 [Protopterus annectens]